MGMGAGLDGALIGDVALSSKLFDLLFGFVLRNAVGLPESVGS